MSEFEDKLNQILSSPDTMDQIMSMARSLGLGGGTGDSTDGAASPNEPASTNQASTAASSGGAAGLLSLLNGGGGEGGGMDPKLTGMLLRLASAWNTPDDDKIALLNALRPFLKSERAQKMQRAMQIAKLSRVIRIALDSFKGEDVDV